MERIKKVLKESSHYISHPTNMAKEYALFDDGRFLEIGRDCFIHAGRNLYTIIEEDKSFKLKLEEEKFVICYGISLTNITSLLHNQDVEVLSISKVIEKYISFYVLSVQNKKKQYPESFSFKETNSLDEFEKTELGDYICNLYGYKYEAR